MNERGKVYVGVRVATTMTETVEYAARTTLSLFHLVRAETLEMLDKN